MPRVTTLTVCAAAVLVVAARVSPAAGKTGGDDGEWASLFNGKDLTGWVVKAKPTDKAKGFWKVDEGTITADSMGHKGHDYVWLMSEKEFGDFELNLKFKAYRKTRGNTGVQIRSRYDDKAYWLDGPQVDVHPPGPWRTGMIWDETRGNKRWLWPKVKWPKPKDAVKGHKFIYDGEGSGWNEMTITARGTKLGAVLNGVAVMDWDGAGVLNDETHRKRNVGMKGHLALQIHRNDQVRIRFKDIRIRELK